MCNMGSVGLLRIEQTFSTPQIYRQKKKAQTTGDSRKRQNVNFP